ncbi:multidrug resistance-associated protein 4-like [Centruroides sculpturatus]|uniref:multidrug resistance-associated protein 4-like n=1 Tax=Centruroides sculpturatus TaxID=218467 RepID=UPI000C6E2924|nr:multidrug resistance-associated protein 4-like [Centruroides sculpturatus]
MDEENRSNPYDSAGVFSRIFFCWLFPLLLKGRKRPLQENDLYATSKYHSSQYLGDLLQKEWDKEIKLENPSLTKALLRFIGWKYMLLCLLPVIQEAVLVPVQAYVLGLLVNYFDHAEENNKLPMYITIVAFYILAGVFLLTFLTHLIISEMLGMKIKIAFSTVIYKKAIRLSSSSLAKSNIGQMVSLLANDVTKFYYSTMYCWLFPLLLKGRKRPLQENDLYATSKYHSSQYLGDLLQKEWDKEIKLENPSLTKALLRFIGWKYMLLCLLPVIQEAVLVPVQAYVLGLLVNYFDHAEENNKLPMYITIVAFYILAGVFLLTFLTHLIISEMLGMKIKIAFSTVIYKKAIRLSSSSLAKSNIGQMVSLLANDVTKFYYNIFSLAYVFADPLIIIAVVAILWQYFGWTVLVGISTIFIFVPIQLILGKVYSKLRLQIAKAGDERLNLLNEMIAGMRLIKMYTWEKPFTLLIEKARKREIRKVKRSLYLRGIAQALSYSFSKLFSCLTFLTFFFYGGHLTAQIVFVNMSLSICLFRSIFYMFSIAVTQFADNLTSIKRLQTSLLMTILGEIPICSGKVIVNGKIAYASQEAWLFNGTIRENILFGGEYREDKYNEVLYITALEKDISLFPKGDLTRVGERGTTMSGGQKARINLARALYRDADIFILDDPLSAVDTPVAKHIFEKCIMKYLSNKICILVTHQIHFLQYATKILVLKQGNCAALGDYNKIMNSEINLGISANDEKYTQKEMAEEELLNTKDVDIFHSVEIENTANHVNLHISFILKKHQLYQRHSSYLFNSTIKDETAFIDTKNIENFTLAVNNSNETGGEDFLHRREINVYVYVGLIFGLLVVTFISVSVFYEMSMAASINLHKNMFRCIIRTPITFLDMNPIGIFKDDDTTLKAISLDVQVGELLVVVGSIGSGKTSLLMTILGEIPICSGKVIVNGKIAYASQEAWLFNGTIRENILFGGEYREDKYNEVLYITALEKDISLFPKGDLTRVGERGTTMSGGQKARINLARALYRDADIFILDDPLSAVDTPVAKHIFEKCIMKYLSNKICILVTHQIHFLQYATKILVLKQGNCAALGDYNKIMNSEINLGISANDEKYTQKEMAEEELLNTKDVDIFHSVEIENTANHVKENVKATKENEEKSFKSLGISVYKAYVDAGANSFFKIIILFFLIVSQAVTNGGDIWLLKWIKDETAFIDTKNIENFTLAVNNSNETGGEDFLHRREINVYVYVGLIFGLLVVTFISVSVFYEMSMAASINLHKNMFRCIIRTPITFLDMNPIGKIINRFSKDMMSVDEVLSYLFQHVIRMIALLLGIFVVEAIINLYLLIFTVILTIVFYFLWTFHTRALKSIKYLEGKARSPVFSHLSATLYGLTTIRAFKVENNFKIAFNEFQDKHTATWFLYVALNSWISIYGELICFINLLIIIVMLDVMKPTENAGSKVGLALNYGILMFLYYPWLVRQTSEIDYQMNSVSRILNYSKLNSEAAYESSPDKQPPLEWPKRGEIKYDNVSLQYSKDKPAVLKELTFHINPGEKIGIVGRTGAGKSSLIAALFRLIEPTGKITIDGINTKDIGLRDLRSKMSIIPQDPVLFTGPLRRNIDPFNEYSEEILWQVIEEVQLKQVVGKLPGGLDTILMEGGRNFSVGQRQLICLARAVLRQNNILVLDEATSNMDKITDSLIQKIIREKFKLCTVLTIAHRLNTIIDSDRVLVLDAGEIQEFDKPHVLLNNVRGIFYNLVMKTGRTSMKQLCEIAKDEYFLKESVLKTKL